jgi:hypothetical protein
MELSAGEMRLKYPPPPPFFSSLYSMWVGGAASGATRKKATDACRLQGGATPHEASDAWVGLRAAET